MDDVDKLKANIGDEDKIDYERLNAEWATLVAVREMLGIALKGKSTPTYEQALELVKATSPELFDSESTVLGKRERDIVKEYQQRAEAKSALDERDVTPIEIVNEEITNFGAMLGTPGDRDLIQKRLHTLENIKTLLQPKKYTENQLIIRDLFKAQRDIYNPSVDKDTYREFKLDNDRGLRIRLLHPDKPEHATGADLIYETYWDKYKVVRVAFVQYKIWDGTLLYSSQSGNLEEQLEKLTSVLCKNGYCEAATEEVGRYRLPHCSAFLRPTDKLQNPDSRLISSGLHTPVCVAAKAWEETGRNGKKIERKRIRSESLSPKVFEELLNTNMLGSRWLRYKEIQTLYRQYKVFDAAERIVVHAQEFGI